MDPRFDPSSNPRFKKAPLKTRKTLIDDRFQRYTSRRLMHQSSIHLSHIDPASVCVAVRMFDDKAFQTHTVVDPYGRRNRDVKADDMRRFYRMEDVEEPAKGHKQHDAQINKPKKEKALKGKHQEQDADDEIDDEMADDDDPLANGSRGTVPFEWNEESSSEVRRTDSRAACVNPCVWFLAYDRRKRRTS